MMAWRFRKSFKLPPGVRLNVGTKSASIRFGGKYGGYTVSTSGRKTSSFSIPGTGVGFVSTTGGNRRRAAQNNSAGRIVEELPTVNSAQPVRKRSGLWVLAAVALAVIWYNFSTREPPASSVPAFPQPVQSSPAPTTAPQPSADVRGTSGGTNRHVVLLRTTAAVRLRERPSTEAPILMTVGVGVPVHELGRSGEWRQVSVAAKMGWIHGDYLAEEGLKEAATEPTPSREVLQGRASVIDGDTLEINGKHVRLNGIDAPESDQQCEDAKHFRYSCGWQATGALDDFLAKSRPLRCEFVEWDQYGRFVGDCFLADGTNVAAWMVENGQALDWPKYSNGAYAAQQSAAKAAKRGMWRGYFEEPWSWRSEHAERGKPSQPLGILSRPAMAQTYSCQPRRKCPQISSCEEAYWYLNNCSWGGKLDRDSDGIPCESLC